MSRSALSRSVEAAERTDRRAGQQPAANDPAPRRNRSSSRAVNKDVGRPVPAATELAHQAAADSSAEALGSVQLEARLEELAPVVHISEQELAEAAEELIDLDGDGSAAAEISDPGELKLALQLVATLEPQDAADLRDLIGLTISTRRAGERRNHEQGLLVSLVLEGGGEVPQVRDYEDLRRRQPDPSAHPSASKLSRDYRGWLRAVAAAMRLAFSDQARVPSNLRHSKREGRRNYSTSELVLALLRCARTLGYWPGEGEWELYQQLARDLHHLAGASGPCEVPSLQPFKTRFGTFKGAVRTAQRMVREHRQ